MVETASLHQKYLSSALIASAQRKDLYKNSAGLQEANERRSRAVGAESKVPENRRSNSVCDCLKGFSAAFLGWSRGWQTAGAYVVPQSFEALHMSDSVPTGTGHNPEPSDPIEAPVRLEANRFPARNAVACAFARCSTLG